VNEQEIMDIASLIYGKWSETMDSLDHVKKETDDGSPDWNEFHEIRLAATIADEKKWFSIRNNYNAENRAVINKAFGI